MTVVSWIIEILFEALCGCVGYAVVKVITFGKVELNWKEGGESVAASVFGVVFLLMLVFFIAWLTGHTA